MRDRVSCVVFAMVVVLPGSVSCGNEEECGDGAIDAAEQCDDGNQADGDGCSAACTLELPSPIDIMEPGSALSVTGTIDGTEPSWVRPSESCAPGLPSQRHYFDVIAVVNNTGAEQALSITATWAGGDGFLHVFADMFTPFSTGCTAGNDDHIDPAHSRITGVTIAPGQVLYIIVSTFEDNAVIGAYTIDIRTGACGDGITDPREVCDDGNTAGGDGCSAECIMEPPAPINIAPLDGSITVTGTLDGTEYLWVRPDESCEPEATVERCYLDIISVANNTDADHKVTITATWASGDGYLHVFADPFNPFEPSSCIVGNDDLDLLNRSRIPGVEISAGEVLHVIASTYSGEDPIGEYAINIRTSTNCGNGALDPGEQCDDGNDADGDGCDAACLVETTI